MINHIKTRLLDASHRMSRSPRPAPRLKVGGIFTALLLLLAIVSKASPAPLIPLVTGNTTICIGTTTTLNATPSGGTWTSANTAIATVGSATGIVYGVAGGAVLVTYTQGTNVAATLITVTSPISGPSAVCTGNTLQFTDATPTGLWSTSSATTAAVDVNGNVTGIAAGTVTITYGRVGACYVTKTVSVNANPIPSINGTGVLNVCVNSTTTLTDGQSGGTWSSGSTSIATINSGSGLAGGVSAGASTITYSYSGCYVTKTLNVSATSGISPITGASSVCVGNTTNLSDATYLGTWTSSDATKAAVNAAGQVTGLAPGSVTISYNKNGCSATSSFTVVANNVGSITGNTVICVNSTSALADTTASGKWSSSNTTLATVDSVSGLVKGLAAGSPVITYAITGGCAQSIALTISASTVVGAINGASSLCKASTITLNDSIPGGTWSSSNTSIASINAYGVVTGVNVGVDTITYTRMGCARIKSVSVNALPVISGTLSVCTFSTTALTSTGSGKWKSGNTNIATVDSNSGVVTGLQAGIVTISYTSTCMATVQVTVNGPVAISGNSSVCIAPFTYLYLADPTSGGTWSSSNTLYATVNSYGVVTGVGVGTATITYTLGSCYVTKPISINAAPGIISGNFAICSGATTMLTDTSAGGTWASANTAIASVGSTTGVVTGGVTAGGTVITYSKNGCAKTVNFTVSAALPPVVGPSSVCSGLATIQMIDTPVTGGIWSASNTSVSVSAAGVVTGVNTGTATISYTKGSCSATKVVTVTANGVSSVAGVPYVCTGLTNATIFDGTVGGVWSVRDAYATINSTSGLVTGVSAGTTVISYTQPSTGCFKTMVFNVQGSPDTIVGGYSVCVANNLNLSETTIGGNWLSSNSTIANVSTSGVVTGVSAGTVTITFSKNGCSSYQPVTVLNNPVSAIGGTTSVCAAMTTTLTATPAGGVWTCTNTALATIGSATGIVGGVATGNPVISYTILATGCYATKTVSVNSVYPGPITGNMTVCLTDTINLFDAMVGGSWKASNNKASIAATGIVTASSTAGMDTITYTYIGCPVTTVITVNANPVGPITGTMTLCTNSTTALADTTSGGTWSTIYGSIATVGSSGVVSGVATGLPVITYTGTGGCYRIATLTVNAAPAPISGSALVCPSFIRTLTDVTPGGTWSSSNTAIANLVADGQVYGVAAGNATITYSWFGCYVTMPMTVAPNPASVVITPSTAKICITGSGSVTDATSGGTWSSSDLTIASVSSGGTITPVAAGSATITYTEPVNGCIATKSVSFGTPPTHQYGPNSVCTNASIFLNDTTLGGSWSISDATKATVSSWSVPEELVYGEVAGSVWVIYTTPGCTPDSFALTVNPSPQSILGTYSVCKLSTQPLYDSTAGGAWTSSNTAIATIGSGTGVVTGVLAGTTTITYTATNGCVVTQPFVVDGCGLKPGNTTDVTELAEAQVYTLFPNPSSGYVTITQSISDDAVMPVTVVNYVGATVFSNTVSFNGGRAHLNMSNVVPGMYLVILREKSGQAQTFKVVIDK